MTRLEFFNTGDPADIHYYLCTTFQYAVEAVEDHYNSHFDIIRDGLDACKGCPAERLCGKGQNGFSRWLMEDIED